MCAYVLYTARYHESITCGAALLAAVCVKRNIIKKLKLKKRLKPIRLIEKPLFSFDYLVASSIICLKIAGWCSASVARILRSSSMCFVLRAFISLLYVMPFMRDPAFIFMLHNVRRTRFFLRLSLKRCTPACNNASRAWRSFDFLPHRNPFVCFKTFRRRFTEMVPRLTRVIYGAQSDLYILYLRS